MLNKIALKSESPHSSPFRELAIFSSQTQAINQVVLWDKIIQRGDSAIIDVYNTNNKYSFFDDGKGLK